ncbi:MAG: hypothetical protein EOO46_07400 [Flavobacterium sp.]|nr:MAG: hypothetical protein EOO46_07400 [Flavobacterium sp.]
MNTNQNDTFGQGNRDRQHPNQDANSNQSGQQYGGSESDRFSGNDGRQDDDQRLSSHPDGNESDSRNSENDNEDRRLGERDFNSGNAGNNDQNRPFTGNSEEDRRASDARNYGGGDDAASEDARYDASSEEDEDEDLDATDLDSDTDAFEDDEDDLNTDSAI